MSPVVSENQSESLPSPQSGILVVQDSVIRTAVLSENRYTGRVVAGFLTGKPQTRLEDSSSWQEDLFSLSVKNVVSSVQYIVSTTFHDINLWKSDCCSSTFHKRVVSPDGTESRTMHSTEPESVRACITPSRTEDI